MSKREKLLWFLVLFQLSLWFLVGATTSNLWQMSNGQMKSADASTHLTLPLCSDSSEIEGGSLCYEPRDGSIRFRDGNGTWRF